MRHLAFLLICVTWGGSFILMERATHAFGSVDIAIGRVAGGAAVLAIVWWWRPVGYRLTRSDLARLSLAALVGTAWPFVVQPYCLAQDFGHSYFGMLVALVPLTTILVSVPMLDVWPTRRQLAGVLGGLVCMAFLVWDGAERGMTAGLLGLALTVPLSYALGNTYVKWRLAHIPTVPLTTLILALAAAMLLPLEFMPSLVEQLGLARPTEPRDWLLGSAALVFLGAIGTGLAVWLFIGLVVREGPLFAGMVTYVVPVVALAWGAFDREPITLRQVAAVAGILAMVALVQFGGRRLRRPGWAAGPSEPHFCPSEVPAEPAIGGEEQVATAAAQATAAEREQR